MRKNTIIAAIAAVCLSLSSCGLGGTTGTTNNNTGAAAGSILGAILGGDGTSTSVLGSLLDGLLGGGALTQKSLIGTWQYSAPKVAFESENLLAKAGGTIAANKVEQTLSGYLSKVGIKAGVSTFTFNEDGTYVINTKSKTISTGTYTFDANAKSIKMTGMLGLASLNCSIGASNNNIYLMFEADKLLAGANTLATILGKGTLSSLLGNYNGMQVGFTLTK